MFGYHNGQWPVPNHTRVYDDIFFESDNGQHGGFRQTIICWNKAILIPNLRQMSW
jgi:hypothetical protein